MPASCLGGHGKTRRVLARDGIESIAISTIGQVKLFLFHRRDEQCLDCLHAVAS